MTHRSALWALILLIDARRGPGQLDVDLLEYASQRSVPAIICITKADKLSASERGLLPRKFAQELDTSPRNIILTSTLSGQGFRGGGRGDVAGTLGEHLAKWTVDGTLEGQSS